MQAADFFADEAALKTLIATLSRRILAASSQPSDSSPADKLPEQLELDASLRKPAVPPAQRPQPAQQQVRPTFTKHQRPAYSGERSRPAGYGTVSSRYWRDRFLKARGGRGGYKRTAPSYAPPAKSSFAACAPQVCFRKLLLLFAALPLVDMVACCPACFNQFL
jgi:stalled ribosome alternative rescue factor ArfA